MQKGLAKEKKLLQRQIARLEKQAKWTRKKILDMIVKAGTGHIAPSFSCIEILISLYYANILRINPKNPKWEKRDRFILSKGHAAAALYVVLADLGFFPLSELDRFTKEEGYLCAHPEDTIPGIEAVTGSLGHGLSIGAGLALGAKMNRRRYISVVVLGDGECQEGSVWEAAMFSAHHRLNNLVAIIDHNGVSAIDFLKRYLDVEPLQEKWKSFGWEVMVVDGHSFKELLSALSNIHNRSSNKPLAVVALTTKGKGLSFMENKPIWHYRIPTEKELKIAQRELG